MVGGLVTLSKGRDGANDGTDGITFTTDSERTYDDFVDSEQQIYYVLEKHDWK